MGFLQRGVDRITDELRKDHDDLTRARLEAALQALQWALDPVMFRPPYLTIMNIALTQKQELTK